MGPPGRLRLQTALDNHDWELLAKLHDRVALGRLRVAQDGDVVATSELPE
jgi:hypothetical protein